MQLKEFISFANNSHSNLKIIRHNNCFTLCTDTYSFDDLFCTTQLHEIKKYKSLDTLFSQLEKYKFKHVLSLDFDYQKSLL